MRGMGREKGRERRKRSTDDVVRMPGVSPETRRDELLPMLLLISPPLRLLLVCHVLKIESGSPDGEAYEVQDAETGLLRES
jgi:hypothetical protein